MHEAYWNGLFDTRWEDAPLGCEAIPPVPEPTGDSPWHSRQDIIEWLEEL